jgi:hypothetical protein
MNQFVVQPELGKLRDSHAILFRGPIDHDTAAACYEHLRGIGRMPRLDLVLATTGGPATAARRLALLLHEYTDHLTILVPYRARSSGTLLCLAAHELVLGPLAELGPLDPQIAAAGPPQPGQPAVLSAEDLRAFRPMARDWFGVDRPEDRLQVLALVAQRVFPGTLGAFYRAEHLVRTIAAELLERQLPDAGAEARAAIVEQLVTGLYSHDDVITRGHARAMGLRVTYPDAEQEDLLWSALEGTDR